MSYAIYESDELSSWRAYYDRLSDAGVYHSPEYVAALEGHFEPPESAELFVYDPDDAEGFVYYPYFRRPLTSAPFAAESSLPLEEYSDVVSSWYYGGPVLSSAADSALADRFGSSFHDACVDRGIVAEFVRFDPTIRNHETFDCLSPTFDRETVPVDLSGTPDDVWEGYEDRNRRAIEQAREHDLEVVPTREPDAIEAFHDIYSDAMEAKDASEHYRFEAGFFRRLVREHPDVATLLVVRYEGDVIGGFVAVHDDRVAHHFLSASVPDYWDMRVNNYLYHRVVLHFQERGFETFDFQGGRPGVFKFKKGFSGLRGEFYLGTRTHLPDVYDRLADDATEAGVDTETDYFPTYRADTSN